MHDGALARFCRAVRMFSVTPIVIVEWVEEDATPRSPDLKPLDFYL
jgi:hypothetical protein